MAGTVLGVGTGVFLLAALWVSAVLLYLVVSRVPRIGRFTGTIILIGALAMTSVLLMVPRSEQFPHEMVDARIVDTFFICRYVLLGLLVVIFLGSVCLLLVHHILEPVFGKALRFP